MKKFLLILSIISLAAISCADKSATSGKPISSIVPSADSTVKTGTPIAQWSGSKTIYASTSAGTTQTGEDTPTFDLLDRLYTTTWYQSEEEYDDGVVENETTFIFFDKDSKIREVEYENGIQDDPEEYSAVLDKAAVQTKEMQGVQNSDWNAMVVKTQELGDRDKEWTLLYLKDRDVLYVIELDNVNPNATKEDAAAAATGIVQSIEGGNGANRYNEEKFILSVMR